MDFKRSKRLMAIWAACYWILAVTIYLVAGQQFHYTAVTSDALSATTTVGELVDGMTITQRLIAPAESLTGFDLMAATYGRSNTGTLHAVFTNNAGEVVAAKDIDIATLPESKYFTISLDSVAQVQAGDPLTLTLTTTGCMPGNAITIYCGDTIVAGRFDIVQSISEADRYTINGVPGAGKLCVKVNCIRTLTFYRDYWLIIGGAFSALALLCLYWWRGAKDGRNNPLVAVCMLFTRYGFLIRQLVSRDFKTKYKRSALGMAWSFLNHCLQCRFNTLCSPRYSRAIFPITRVSAFWYCVLQLLQRGCQHGHDLHHRQRIADQKVYMPKYIYPVSRILSSLVNFALAIIPLFLVMLITGTAFTPALLLLLFDMLCLLGFVTGMSLLLTTAMTFFQDTQFLWGVVSMMWMYLTPLFYPESIIPAQFLTVYHMNPMYQYITFARICIIDGVSPEPMAYLWCILSSVVVLGLGILTFKRHQDKFVLYL